MSVPEELKSRSVFWSKLGFVYQPPRFYPDGRQIVLYNLDDCVREHRRMYQAGIRLHSSILFSGWTGDNCYDDTETDRTLKAIFNCGDDLKYIPRIKLDVPLDWGKTHPEDMAVYYGGPQDAEQIRATVDTLRHDILGYDAPGYYAEGFVDDRPNRGGVIGNQSFSSSAWLRDAGEALRRVIRHIEEGPYAKRVIGYHIAYGICGESAVWGGFHGSLHCADYGIGHRKVFYEWGLKQYGNEQSLLAAWGKLDIPSPEEREGKTTSADAFFRRRAEDLRCIDYDRFMSDVNVNAMEHFARIVKECSADKPVGVFYGYYMNLPRAAYNGHLGYDRILASPYIDFIASPAGYYKRAAGEPGGEQVCAQSINQKKLFFDELDNRTHLAPNGTADMAETAAVLWREFVKNIMYGSNFWWMDLGGGWFDSDEICRLIGKMEQLKQSLLAAPCHSCADVLLLSDEKSLFYVRADNSLHTALLKESVTHFQQCGALIDHYRVADLPELDLGQYKLIVLLNSLHLDAATAAQLRSRIPESATLLVMYSPDAIAQLADIRVVGLPLDADPCEIFPAAWLSGIPPQSINLSEYSCPLYYLPQYAYLDALVRTRNGQILVGENTLSRRIIASALPVLSVAVLRRIMERAGVVFYGPAGTTVYGNNLVLGVFGADGAAVTECCSEDEILIAKSPAAAGYPFYVKTAKEFIRSV